MRNILADLLPKHLSKPDTNHGIGSPHDGYETLLMLTGQKPCLITGWPLKKNKEDYTQLEPLIASGHISVIAIRESVFPWHIICRPESLEKAKIAAAIHHKDNRGERLERHEWQWQDAFWKDACGITVRNKDGFFIADEMEKRRHGGEEGEYRLILDGQISATLPVMTGTHFKSAPQEIRDAIANGTLCAVFAKTNKSRHAILAQRNCEDMGKELFARYWNNDQGYPPLSGDEGTRRIGHLLGYTPEDTEFFLSIGTQKIKNHSPTDTGRIAAQDLQRYARVRSMLENTPT